MDKVNASNAEFMEYANKLRVASMDSRIPGDIVLRMHNAAIKLEKAAALLDIFANAMDTYRNENTRLRAELEAANTRWEETASDNTGYTLSHFDGIFTVADPQGRVVCEFQRESAESAENGGAGLP